MFRKLTVSCAALLAPIATLGGFALNVAPVSAAILVTNLVDGSNPLPIPGVQAWGGQLGDDFVTTAPLVITSIAVFDSDGDGTSVPLTWQLFDVSTGLPVAQAVVPASGLRTPGTTIVDNYIFQSITPIFLAANTTYSVVAYGFDDANMNFNTNFDLANFDVVFNTLGLNAAGGRYSNPGSFLTLPSVDAGNSLSTNPYNFGAASFEYSGVPEPMSALVWSLIIGASIVAAKRVM